MKHLRFSHISILTNLVQTDNKTKSVKTIYTTISIKNGKKDKEQTQNKYRNAIK